MITFSVRAEGNVGIVEPTGELSDHAIPALRDAISYAQKLAQAPNVLIIEDGITDTSDTAATVLITECKILRAKAGNLALVSTDGSITMQGRPSSATLFMTAYNDLRTARDRFSQMRFS